MKLWRSAAGSALSTVFTGIRGGICPGGSASLPATSRHQQAAKRKGQPSPLKTQGRGEGTGSTNHCNESDCKGNASVHPGRETETKSTFQHGAFVVVLLLVQNGLRLVGKSFICADLLVAVAVGADQTLVGLIAGNRCAGLAFVTIPRRLALDHSWFSVPAMPGNQARGFLGKGII
eukprot:Skav205517  [mRNA]  locus=scaffold231:297969:299537:+ [translate_table: standard]